MDFKQYRQKPKRKLDPNIPRPNLFSHEKKLKELTAQNEAGSATVQGLQKQLDRAFRRILELETAVQYLQSRRYR